MVNILSINSILVNIDIISDSYDNGSILPTIYSLFQTFLPDTKSDKLCLSSNNFIHD